MTYNVLLGIQFQNKGIHSNQVKTGLDFLQMSNF
jgi:hypothetical protein